MRDKILNKASEMFLNLGFKSITMDDIAQEMGVSKKTLYKYYKTKQSLVESTTTRFHDSCIRTIEEVENKKFNPIKENFEIKKSFKEMFKNATSSPMYQLRKYYPLIHERIKEKENVVFSECLKRNIKSGVAQGYYREDINIDLCTQFYFYLVFSVHENTIENDKIPLIEMETLIYHTRAIATVKGVEELEKQLEIINKNSY